MLKKRLSFRLLLTTIVVIVFMIGITALTAGVLEVFYSEQIQTLTNRVENTCEYISESFQEGSPVTESEIEQLHVDLLQVADIYDGRIMITDQEGLILEDTIHADEGVFLKTDEMQSGLEGEVVSYHLGKENEVVVIFPLKEGGEELVIGTIVMSASTKGIEISQGRVVEYLLVVQVGLSIAMAIILIVVIYLATNPFLKLTKELEHMTFNNDYVIQEANSYIETRKIANSVKKMLSRLRILDHSREEFVANVSHELKTPLTSMKVLADSLLSQEDVPVELYREFMEDIAEEIDRENVIINDLLSLVKMEKASTDVHIKSVDINEMMEGILKRVSIIAEMNQVEVVLESFRPTLVEADEIKLSLAYMNLIENAIKYNEPGGYVHISVNSDYQYCYINVEDSGIGIKDEEKAKIFERFYRIDKSRSREIGGTGLGLAIAQKAIFLHKGEILVQNNEIKGTTFATKLPLTYVR